MDEVRESPVINPFKNLRDMIRFTEVDGKIEDINLLGTMNERLAAVMPSVMRLKPTAPDRYGPSYCLKAAVPGYEPGIYTLNFTDAEDKAKSLSKNKRNTLVEVWERHGAERDFRPSKCVKSFVNGNELYSASQLVGVNTQN